MRYYNGRKIDLMAPAGNFENFKKIVKSNCDSIFLGGEKLNMRRIRKGYNFTNDELEQVMIIAKQENKKIYVTVNILINENELEETREYLIFLNKIKVDAIIVQDLAILKIIKELDLKIPIHSSVMMNTHDLETIKFLKENNFSKIVLSRETTIEEIREFYNKTKMSFEYFCYGDMCVAKDAQCNISSFILGNNSGRGRCFKPCRWKFTLEHNNNTYNTKYPLAVKDLSLYKHIDALHTAGIETFKIEGRMKNPEFIVPIINKFGDAIDGLINESKYDVEDKYLNNNRIRDLSDGFINGNPKLNYINERNEENVRIFSKSTKIKEISQKDIRSIKKVLNKKEEGIVKKISVYVSNLENLRMAIEEKVDRVYLSLEFEKYEGKNLLGIKKGKTKVYLATPRTMNEKKYKDIELILEEGFFDGVLYSTLGAINYFKKYKLITDTNLLAYNSDAIDEYSYLGAKETGISFELQQSEFIPLIKNLRNNIEVTVHGILPLMYTSQDLFDNVGKQKEKRINKLLLKSDKEDFEVVKDLYNMNYILAPKELCLNELIPTLKKYENIKTFRIDGRFYKREDLRKVIILYKYSNEKNDILQYTSVTKGLTLGALGFGGEDAK